MICDYRNLENETIVKWKIDSCPRIGEQVVLVKNQYTYVEHADFFEGDVVVDDVVHVLEHNGASVDQTAIVYLKTATQCA